MIDIKTFKSKLSLKIILLLIVIVFGLMSLFSAFQINRIKKNLLENAEKNHTLFLTNALVTISKSLWELDRDSCSNALKPLFAGGTIYDIQVFDAKERLFYGLQYSKEKNKLEVIENKKNNYQSLKINPPESYKLTFSEKPNELIFPMKNLDNQKHRLIGSLWWKELTTKQTHFIGIVVMDFSTEYIETILQEQKLSLILLTLALSITILILTFISLQYQVIYPIRSLMQASLDVSAGIFTKIKPLERQDEISLLTNNFNFMISKIEANISLEKEKANLERDLELTKTVQNMLLSKDLPKSNYYDAHSFYKSADQCGGDWFGIYELSHDKVFILFGDVSGHGTPAALITAVTCGAADMFVQSLKQEKESLDDNIPKVVLKLINKSIYQVCKARYIMTMIAIFIDFTLEKMHIASAGQTPPILILQDKNKLISKTIYPPVGCTLGLKEEEDFESITLDFKQSQELILFTDGIVESENKSGVEYGIKNFKKSIEHHSGKSPEVFLKCITDDTMQYSEGLPQKDDITLLLLRFLSKQ